MPVFRPRALLTFRCLRSRTTVIFALFTPDHQVDLIHNRRYASRVTLLTTLRNGRSPTMASFHRRQWLSHDPRSAFRVGAFTYSGAIVIFAILWAALLTSSIRHKTAMVSSFSSVYILVSGNASASPEFANIKRRFCSRGSSGDGFRGPRYSG